MAFYPKGSEISLKFYTVKSLEELPSVLIQARKDRGWTQEQLAEKLGLNHKQQIQRYEALNYANISYTKLVEVAKTLGIKLKVLEFELIHLTHGS